MAEKETDLLAKIEDRLGMSHPPFHGLGVIPFGLGTFLAWRLDRLFDPAVFALGVLGIALVMLSARHAGEYLARRAAAPAARGLGHSAAGPDRATPKRIIRLPGPLRTGVAALSAALLIGAALQFVLQTGPFTLPLACIGILPGLFFAALPIHRADYAIGELLIAFGYGWLPIAAGFYLQRGYIAPCVHWMALPIGLSLFNVVLLNDFTSRNANPAGAGTSLLDRLGTGKGVALYALTSILGWFAVYASRYAGIPRKALYIYLPVMGLSAVLAWMMAGKRYENPFVLEIICGLNLAVHLGTEAAYLLAFL